MVTLNTVAATLGAVVVAAVLFVGLAALEGQLPAVQIALGSDTLQVRWPTFKGLLPGQEATLPEVDASLIAAAEGDPNARPRYVAGNDTLPNDTSALGRKHRIANPLRADSTRPLDAFFYTLARLEGLRPATAADKALNLQDPVRIAHYGDSQIEGDRITHHIRAIFQRRFGGSGPGYVAVSDPANAVTYTRKETGAWRRYTVFQDKLKSGLYFQGGFFFRFLGTIPARKDTAGNEIPARYFDGAGTTLELPPFGIQRVRLLMGPVAQAVFVTLQADGTVLMRDSLPVETGFHTALDMPLARSPGKVRLEFKGNVSPDVYGLLLDGKGGVAVDNYALRGHSGDGLLRIANGYLRQQLATTQTRLVIFQFGGNMIPYLTPKKMEWVEDLFYQLFAKYRAAYPHAAVLVVSPADMATKVEGEYRSYPIVKVLAAAQKRAALKAGCAFWDLYEAMGGEGSILSWSRQKPELAAADYAHFSPAGQRVVGNLLARAILNEYEVYLKRNGWYRDGLPTAPALPQRKPQPATAQQASAPTPAAGPTARREPLAPGLQTSPQPETVPQTVPTPADSAR
jgi:lysophospholipase L1-like esterase